MKKLAVLGLALALSACATSREMTAPSGNKGFYIKCNGLAVSMDVCYTKASQVCPNGYEIVSKDKTMGGAKKGVFVECLK